MEKRTDRKELYEALVNKDASFEGIFFAGIRSTGIFCRPGCPARKPKEENVEFFSSAPEALSHGYRPCKRCNPMNLKDDAPAWLAGLLNEIESNSGIRMKDADLKERGLDPTRVRRWFKDRHNMTFQAYQRALRISEAYSQMQSGGKVIDAAFDSGYDSLSGFTDAFKKTTGFSPNRSRSEKIITLSRILTPLGPMAVGAMDDGICLFDFNDRRMLETHFRILKKRLNAEIIPGDHQHFQTLSTQISEYFDGRRKTFDLPMIMAGTEFQMKAWQGLQSIPYGEIRTYEEQARLIGQPTAVRAVARANGENRFAIIIPCHRVVGKNGSLTGYGGGLWRKKRLLDLELKFAV